MIAGDYCIAATTSDGRRVALKVKRPGVNPYNPYVIKAQTADGHTVGVSLQKPAGPYEDGIAVVTADKKKVLLVTEPIPKCLFKVKPGIGIAWSYPRSVTGESASAVAATSDGGCVALVSSPVQGKCLHKFDAAGEIVWSLTPANSDSGIMFDLVEYAGAIWAGGNARQAPLGNPTNLWKINAATGAVEQSWGLASVQAQSGIWLEMPNLRFGQSGGNFLAILGSGQRVNLQLGGGFYGWPRTHALLNVATGAVSIACDNGVNSSNVSPAGFETSSTGRARWLTFTGGGFDLANSAERYGWSSGTRHGVNSASNPTTIVECAWEGFCWGDPTAGGGLFHATDRKTVWTSLSGWSYYGWQGDQVSTHGIMLPDGSLLMNSVESGGTFWEKRNTDTSLLAKSAALAGVYSPSGPYLRTRAGKVMYASNDLSRIVEMDSGFVNLWEWLPGATISGMDYAADGDVFVSSGGTTTYDREGGTFIGP